MTYSEKLRDPRWQKKRLQIMERDGFACRVCSATTKPLNVHHLAYFPRTDPWDYPSQMLITLCDDDHKAEEEGKSAADAMLIEALRSSGAMNLDLDRIAQIVRELGTGPGALAIIQRALDEAWTEAKR